MKEKNQLRSLSAVASLMLLAVFAVVILFTLLGGAGAYRRLTQQSAEHFDSRTCALYVTTKLRQAPEGVQLAPFGDGEALVIPQTYHGTAYLTRIYCYDGWLMELFTAADGSFSPEDGERLLPVADLELAVADGLLTAYITDESGEKRTILLDLGRCGYEK